MFLTLTRHDKTKHIINLIHIVAIEKDNEKGGILVYFSPKKIQSQIYAETLEEIEQQLSELFK